MLRRNVTETREWKIETPQAARSDMKPKILPEHVLLTQAWVVELVRRGTYTPEEAAALQDPNGISSWAAPMSQQFGPLPTIARAGDRLIAAVDLWQQKRDHYWFISDLVRDQSPEFKGVGKDVVEAAIMWWMSQFSRTDWGLRVFAMKREVGAVKWCTHFLKRSPDLTEESTKSRACVFPAVGWILVATRPTEVLLRR
jgi:hypothetical protein